MENKLKRKFYRRRSKQEFLQKKSKIYSNFVDIRNMSRFHLIGWNFDLFQASFKFHISVISNYIMAVNEQQIKIRKY